MDKEIRYNKVQLNNNNSRTVEGYAVVFNSLSENIGFFEIIKEGAITEDTIKNSDVFAKFNHDDSKILARSKFGEGSLELSLDREGLKYKFEAPRTELGDELLEHIRRSEINQSSFAFTVSAEKGSEIWSRDKDNNLIRTINKIDKIYDVSPVFQPAYSKTTCVKRKLSINSNFKLIDEINKLYNIYNKNKNTK